MGKRSSNKQMQRGQAMVEFALTSLLFILLVVSIIEIARIMHAYVTIQHAARVAGRYAVTGQWMPEFSGANGAAHYNADSGDPYARIYPCWPRFNDDPMPKAQTPEGTVYFEPYRGPRTCSVEKQALQQMRPLALVPDAGFNQAGHYQVVVSSPSSDSTPTNGSFIVIKDGVEETRYYDDYYDNDLPTAEMVRGYAGKPNGQVIVQIRYNIRLVTPLLSNIVPYIPLQARVVMTNEAFGSTSVLTEAAPAPNMRPVGPLHMPIDPDLTFVVGKAKNLTGHTNPLLDESLKYEVTITNSGELNAVTSFDVCLYASEDELEESDLNDATTLASLKKQCSSVPRLEAGMDHTAQITLSGWGSVGPRYIYAVVDPAETADSGDNVAGKIDEKGSEPAHPQQEKNNWLFIEEIEVGKGINLGLEVSIVGNSDNMPQYSVTQTFDIQVIVNNPSTKHEVNNLSIHIPLPSQLTVTGSSCSCYADFTLGGINVPREGTTTIIVSVRVDQASGGPETLWAEIQQSYLPEGYYDEDGTWPLDNDQRVQLQNN